MRVFSAALFWLLATVTFAVALPTAWAQTNLIDADGYARLAEHAAAQPALQDAVAAELSAQTVMLIRASGFGIDPSEVRAAARSFTTGPSFPPQFVRVNRDGHAWLLNVGDPGPWEIDVIPMLRDDAFAQLLADYPITLPATLTIPLTSTSTEVMRPGGLHRLSVWGPLLSVVLGAMAGLCAILTLVAAHHRGRALASLGVSALLVGAVGWSGIEVARRFLGQVLSQATGDVRRIAYALVDVAEASLHQWLGVTLAAGAVLVVVGVGVAVLGGLRKS
ncbi:hypothetical protein [Mycolicibacter arupensis]|uniref:Uncharacterized protein n=1 Tax=Mycolicibacter arupensis TaxID=342002 RepID=A0A0F5MWM8_9MYCO|nr:hypothetical protein [Mycolicibacter arupensis]KAA1431698.1 hypothetical protein F0402_07435 [Mycolicibacter arupensis]KKB99101.1 hypothetical protein WR43_11275 [Mycolicibacter arupensis]MCV7276527.1 hypothetical protein [Mycolicibacter arupensis]OQZ97156.1 hypothetical protein BST15_10780 [Mycolicibacter arupensis]